MYNPSISMPEYKKSTKLHPSEERLIHFIVWAGILLPPFFKAGTPRLPGLFIQLLALILLFNTIYHSLRRMEWILSYHPIDMLVVLFLLLSAFSAITTGYKYDTQRCFLLIISFAIFYFHIAAHFSLKSLERLWWGLIGLGVFESAFGIYQAFFLNESRISGTFHNPNHLSGFLACLFMILIARMVFNPHFRKNVHVKICLTVFLGLGILLTGSRGGILALIGGAVGLAILMNTKKKALRFLAFILFLLLIIWLIPNPLINRIKQIRATDVYAYSRWDMWKSALHMLKDYPLMGVGLGNFGYFSYRYAFPVAGAWAKYARVARYAHNELLQLGAETGIPGILFFLTATAMVFAMALKKHRCADHHENKGLIFNNTGDQKALLVGLITLLFHSAVDFIFHIPPIIFLLLIIIIWMRGLNINRTKTYLIKINFSKKGRYLMTLVSLAFLIFLASIPIRQYLGFIIFQKANGKDLLTDIRHIQKALEIDFGCAPYHNSLGGAYFKLYGIKKDSAILHQGVKEAELAQTLNPDDHRFPLSLGLGYLNLFLNSPIQKDTPEKAEREFRKCLILAPYLYQGFLGLGQVLFYQNKPKEALNIFNEVVRLEPYSISGYYWLGLTYEAIGDMESAQMKYKKAMEIKGLGLEKKSLIAYEKELIDFDINKIYFKLKNNFKSSIMSELR